MISELNQIGWLMGNKVVSVLPGQKKGVIKQTKVTVYKVFTLGTK